MEVTPRAARSYLAKVFGILAAGALVIGWTLATVDPYGTFRRWGYPTLKTEPILWSRVSAAERLSDDCGTALLGSSRVVWGFGPHLPKWWGRNACNGALGGTSVAEVKQAARYVLEETDTERLLLFLDFHMFKEARGTNGDFRQSRMNEDRSTVSYYLWSLTSWDAFSHAARIMQWRLPGVEGARPMLPPLPANQREVTALLASPRLLRDFRFEPTAMDDLGWILDAAAAKGVKVLIIIPPLHALGLECLHEAGVWEENKAWKDELVSVVSARPASVLQVWDFATYHRYASLPQPTRRGQPRNRFWIDVQHQSSKLGTALLTRIHRSWTGTAVDDGFGVLLSPEMLPAHHARLDADRAAWIRANPDQIAWFKGAVAQAKLWIPDDNDELVPFDETNAP